MTGECLRDPAEDSERIRRPTNMERTPTGWKGTFTAMASPCEVLVDGNDSRLPSRLVEIAAREAWRIEAKFSRYRADSTASRINASAGRPVEVDDETARLLDFAAECHRLSDGRFDVTSGVLRRVWEFDGGDGIPTPEQVTACLPFVGWGKVKWEPPVIVVPKGMEVDLGGIGKEYAVDRTLGRLKEETDEGVLVNFGGDMHASGARRGDLPWRVGVESVDQADEAARELEIRAGALATSGDTRRYLEKDGVRYCHVLDPRTGWPVVGAPRSVTVLGGNCTEAGLLATLAMLHGAGAEKFLGAEGARYWALR